MTLTAKRTLAMLAAVILVVGAIGAYKLKTIRALQARAAAAVIPPATVSTTVAPITVWQRQFHSVGSLAAVQGVTVSNQIEGSVVKIAFESGQHVKAGDLLIQQDVSTDTAQLSGLEAQADLALLTLNRARELRAKETNSQADLDNAEAQCREASSAVENERAVIGKKTIRAPFSGLLGLRQVNLGQFLPAGAPIAALQALDPIYVNFSLPQQDVGDLHAGQTVRITVDAYPGAVFEGKINAVNSMIDEATRNIQVQATIRNADERLVPGMFAGVDVILSHEDRLVTLPETAIVYNPYGTAVYIIERTTTESGGQRLVARQHFVTLGETRGDQVAVVKGVKAGDEVVTAGQLKLRNGAPVVVDNSAQPAANPAPNLPNT
jgi:membrane fusion protein (multidrug efflux system)